MNLRFCIYLLITGNLFLVGCQKNRDVEEKRYTWLTEAPLTIPLRTRIQRFEKGNLIRNHSFESGRTFTLDNSKTSFVIDGWQQIGQQVQWVDTRQDSLYSADEAISGFRSVKIVRKKAYETDEQGDGIISEFIKVIPGNYTLSCYLKLENVFPAKSRLGTRMYDAIEVNLLYYDRNKIAVSPKYKFPQTDQYINASFKSLSFANFTHIPSFGWGKIIGKSEHFPFPEGDIPTDAHYVKVFIGLKGKGTMWIDSVTLTYNVSNFSVAERMRNYTDTAFSSQQAIIPTPKKYQVMESLVLSMSDFDHEKQPLILIPSNADAVIMKAAKLIQEALQKSITGKRNIDGNGPLIRVVDNYSDLQLDHSKLIFSLGTTELFTRFQAKLPVKSIDRHPQGYFIYTTGDRPNLVFLGGNSTTGIYYAALTVRQMIDGKKPVFHNARIIDYPDIADRFYAIKAMPGNDIGQQKELAEELILYKFNGAFYEVENKDDEHPSKSLVEKSLPLPVPRNELFRIYSLPPYSLPFDSTLTYSFPVSSGMDKSKPVSGRELIPMSEAEYPGYPHLVIPPAFHNQLLDNAEFPEQYPAFANNIRNLYAGCSYFSVNTDDADIDRYIAYVGSKPVFMDNSMQIHTQWGHYAGNDPFYPGKIRLFNMFEPYGNADIREYFSKLDTALFFINHTANSEMDLIRLATAADFLWNTNTYTKDHSLWKVLQSRYGAEVSRELLTYADKYGLMLEIFLKMKSSGQASRNHKTGLQIMADLDLLVASIGDKLGPDHRLVKELELINATFRNKLN
jgi:hypothetical protein